MGKVNHIQNSFNAGELSPRLASRFDFEKYNSGCYQLENFIPTVQGSIVKRSGTIYAATAKDTTNAVTLIPFTDTNGTSYIIEASNQVFRFFKADGVLVGAPFELATVFTSSDVYNLQYAQSGDVMYITGVDRPIQKLSKNSSSDTDWSISEVVFAWPPFDDRNDDTSAEFYVSAASGTGITITAVGHTPFDASMANAGLHIKLEDTIAEYQEWVTAAAVAASVYQRYGDNVYQESGVGGTTGAFAPVHTSGTVSDGGVSWTYVHSGEGYLELKNFTSSTQMTADVKSTIPSTLVGSGNETSNWSWGSWSSDLEDQYPNAVAIYEDRLILAGSSSKPQTIWGSVVGDYENFKSGVTDSDSWSYTLGSQDLNTIRWLVPARVLMIGTDFGEFTMSGSRIYESITPTNVRVTRQSSYGSKNHRPWLIGNRILVTQKESRKVREFSYDYESDSYVGVDRTMLSEHITYKNITQGAKQNEPFPIIWYPIYDYSVLAPESKGSGAIAAMTYDNVENTYAWHKHVVGGDGVVKSMAVIPNGNQDQVWFVVQRTINGVSTQYIEYMDPPSTENTEPEDHHYVDCGAVYDGAATITITGLSHLEGETVRILADGSTHPDKTVSSGQITLDRSASKVHVGLGYTAKMQTMPIAEGGDYGPSHGQTTKISSIQLRLLNTGPGLFVGKDSANTVEIQFRSPGMSMDGPVPLFTGLKGPIAWPTGQERDMRIYTEHNLPLPCELLAAIADMVVYDK